MLLAVASIRQSVMFKASRLPGLPAVLNALRSEPGLVAMDCGSQWSVLTWGEGEVVRCGAKWADQARALLREQSRDPALPFTGGLVGWLGYESGRQMERMPAPTAARPAEDLLLWRVEGGLCLNHRTGQWHIAGDRGFSQRAQQALQQAELPIMQHRTPPSPPAPATQARYTDGVRQILAANTAGDVYQVCLAWQKHGLKLSDPLGAWLSLRENNPALRGAWLQHGKTHILCNSPELFLEIIAEGEHLTAQSIPIKGTVRCADGISGRLELWESEKERAELTMIVDLVRNDLGRIARPGSVHAAPRRLRRCGDLLHAEQPVTATLEPGRDAFDAVCAAFPPGSVTGAPKVAAMEMIARLESTPRGVYTGAIGFFADGGNAHLNVAIRTATVQNGRGSFHVGAGIVADSDPEREWLETLAKGQALSGWLEGE